MNATTADAVVSFRRELQTTGLHGAIAFLNARTQFRFTGVYAFHDQTVRCVSIWDRDDPQVRTAPDERLVDTYCWFIAANASPFVTQYALADARLIDHPAQQSVVAFHGVPLVDTAGACIGAICHWDVKPRVVPPDEVALLYETAHLLAGDDQEERRGNAKRASFIGSAVFPSTEQQATL
jgi:GAF domain-containing protein